MGKPRYSKTQLDKEEWDKICGKLPPNTLNFIGIFLPQIDNFIKHCEEQFAFPNLTLDDLNREGITDWSSYYTESPPIFSFIELSLKLMYPLLKSPLAVESSDITPKLSEVVYFSQKLDTIDISDQGILSSLIENKSKLILLFRCGLIDFACILEFHETMNQLITKAKKGDDSALFKAIQIDNGLLATTWVNRRVIKASLEADQPFFRKLSETLKRNLKVTKNVAGFKLILFSLILWYGFELYKVLTLNELCEIIEKYKIYAVKDRQNLRRYLNRKGIKKYFQIESLDNLKI